MHNDEESSFHQTNSNVQYYFIEHNTRNIKLNNSDLNVIYLNVCSLKNKLLDYEYFLNEFKTEFDAVIMVESWLNEGDEIFFNLPNYNAFHNIRAHRKGGSSSVFVNKKWKSEVLYKNNDNEIEFTIVHLSQLNINLLAIYRPPIQTIELINKFIEKFSIISDKYENLIVCGDINIDLLTNDFKKNSYLNTMRIYNQIVLNKLTPEMATRVKITKKCKSKTIIDIVSTNIIHKFKSIKFFLCENSMSDHKSIAVSFEMLQRSDTTNSPIKKEIHFCNWPLISKSLTEIAFKTCKFDDFHTELCRTIKSKSKKIELDTNDKFFKRPYFNNQLKSIKIQRNKFYKLKEKFPTNEHYKTQFKYLRKLLKRSLILEKQKYISNKITEAHNQPRKLWKITNSLITNVVNTKIEDDIKLKCSEQILSSPTDVSNILNTFFINVGQNITRNIPKPITVGHVSKNHHDILKNDAIINEFEQTTPIEIANIISKLNNHSAAGFDGIPTRFLKENINFFSLYLSAKINESFSTGLFPDSLKVAKVKAVYKSGVKTDVENYRPISILSVISKIYETAIKIRLETFLETNNIINQNQFGFVKNTSTTAACASLIHKIYEQKSQKRIAGSIFIDFRKAFDCLSFSRLSKILYNYGVRKKALDLISDLLKNRQQFVEICGVKSDIQKVICGVPQGSIIGPLLFNIYINEIFKIKLHGNLQLFADDSVLSYGEANVTTLKITMKNDLNKLYDWLLEYNLVMNVSKTKIMIFYKTKKYDLCSLEELLRPIVIRGESICIVPEYKYLGLVIDYSLNWKSHTLAVAKKITPFIGLLFRIRKYLNQPTLFSIYYAHVDSHLNYCLPIWCRAAAKYLNMLQVIQNKCIKIITYKPLLTPSIELYNENLLSFKQIKYETTLTIIKMLNKSLKCTVNFSTNFSITQRATRQKDQIRAPNFRTSNSQNSFIYCGLQLYNELPSDIKSELNFLKLKALLKTYIYNNYSIQ